MIAKLAWDRSWPTHRPGHNWDAVARLHYGESHEWLLVEAKANVEELSSSCQADADGSLKTIRATLDQPKAALGASTGCDWLNGYYQFCNRLAALHVMNKAGTPARLLYVYFCGDRGDSRRTCPTTEAEWAKALAEQGQHVGLNSGHYLERRMHKLFLNAAVPPSTAQGI